MDYAQVSGLLLHVELVGGKGTRRLTAQLKDSSGLLELTWFQGLNWVQKFLQEGKRYTAFGRVGFYLGGPQIIHPEMELQNNADLSVKSF